MYYVVTYVDVMEAISYLYKLSMNFQVCYNPGLFLLSSYIVLEDTRYNVAARQSIHCN